MGTMLVLHLFLLAVADAALPTGRFCRVWKVPPGGTIQENLAVLAESPVTGHATYPPPEGAVSFQIFADTPTLRIRYGATEDELALERGTSASDADNVTFSLSYRPRPEIHGAYFTIGVFATGQSTESSYSVISRVLVNASLERSVRLETPCDENFLQNEPTRGSKRWLGPPSPYVRDNDVAVLTKAQYIGECYSNSAAQTGLTSLNMTFFYSPKRIVNVTWTTGGPSPSRITVYSSRENGQPVLRNVSDGFLVKYTLDIDGRAMINVIANYSPADSGSVLAFTAFREGKLPSVIQLHRIDISGTEPPGTETTFDCQKMIETPYRALGSNVPRDDSIRPGATLPPFDTAAPDFDTGTSPPPTTVPEPAITTLIPRSTSDMGFFSTARATGSETLSVPVQETDRTLSTTPLTLPLTPGESENTLFPTTAPGISTETPSAAHETTQTQSAETVVFTQSPSTESETVRSQSQEPWYFTQTPSTEQAALTQTQIAETEVLFTQTPSAEQMTFTQTPGAETEAPAQTPSTIPEIFTQSRSTPPETARAPSAAPEVFTQSSSTVTEVFTQTPSTVPKTTLSSSTEPAIFTWTQSAGTEAFTQTSSAEPDTMRTQSTETHFFTQAPSTVPKATQTPSTEPEVLTQSPSTEPVPFTRTLGAEPEITQTPSTVPEITQTPSAAPEVYTRSSSTMPETAQSTPLASQNPTSSGTGTHNTEPRTYPMQTTQHTQKLYTENKTLSFPTVVSEFHEMSTAESQTPLLDVKIVEVKFSNDGEVTATCVSTVKSPYRVETNWKVDLVDVMDEISGNSPAGVFNSNEKWQKQLYYRVTDGRTSVQLMCLSCTSHSPEPYCLFDTSLIAREKDIAPELYFTSDPQTAYCTITLPSGVVPRFEWSFNNVSLPEYLTATTVVSHTAGQSTVWKSSARAGEAWISGRGGNIYECTVLISDGTRVTTRKERCLTNTWIAVENGAAQAQLYSLFSGLVSGLCGSISALYATLWTAIYF
ncbi:envelope glycoprotein J [Gallid alphaherpesvirus 1]|nr:envelope glycoprotein J [Gallid alphaherpesvirus 1]